MSVSKSSVLSSEAFASVELADDATLEMPIGVTGELLVLAGDIDEYGLFMVASDGSLSFVYKSDNVITSDTDGYLCVYDGGSNAAVIKNRLGSSKTIKYKFSR